MDFQSLKSEGQFEKITGETGTNIIFKHNTTCPISKSVIKKLEQEADMLPADTPVYIVDLLSNRHISDSIAATFDVPHQSPQLLVIKDGKCIYSESLYMISAEETAQAVNEGNNQNKKIA